MKILNWEVQTKDLEHVPGACSVSLVISEYGWSIEKLMYRESQFAFLKQASH